MSSPSQRERAEAAFGHVQQAASEMVAAAHDTLDLIGEVVSAADLGGVIDTFNHLSQSLFKRSRPPAADKPQPREERPPSNVQRISVR